MRHGRWVGLAMAATFAVACGNGNNPPARTSTAGTPGAAGTTGTAASTNVDRDWIQSVASDGIAEVQLGELAQRKAQSPEVRAFAKRMVQDHQRADSQLKSIAASNSVQVPTSLDDQNANGDDRDLVQRLSELNGAEFDREYMDAMVDNHKDAIQTFGDKAKDTKANPDVQQFASRTLPTLQQHLDQAQQIDKRLRNTKTGARDR